jgi:hypothetical protein
LKICRILIKNCSKDYLVAGQFANTNPADFIESMPVPLLEAAQTF